MSEERIEYRVVWRRVGGVQKRRIYQTREGAEWFEKSIWNDDSGDRVELESSSIEHRTVGRWTLATTDDGGKDV